MFIKIYPWIDVEDDETAMAILSVWGWKAMHRILACRQSAVSENRAIISSPDIWKIEANFVAYLLGYGEN